MATEVPPEAVRILQTFLDASLRKDTPAMKACLTKRTLESGQMSESGPEGLQFVMGDASWEGEAVLIPVKAYPMDAANPEAPVDTSGAPAMELPALIVMEEGAWKFDLAGTMDRMFGGSMQNVMEQAVGAMGEAMSTVMEGMATAMGEAMSSAFGESSGNVEAEENWLEADASYAAEELRPLPELTPLPKLSETLTRVFESPVAAVLGLGDDMSRLGPTEREALIAWFEDQLFVDWERLFTEAIAQVPAKGRLRRVRIESAEFIDHRMLIIDGSDLVYRVWLNTSDGYYSDAEVRDLLPGLLAGLPEHPEEATAEYRLIHTDQEMADIDSYKQKFVPRYMRRISELLGKNVLLKADWDSLFDARNDARQLYRWGLNRVYGALALACQDNQRREALRKDLRAIEFLLGVYAGERFAKYEDGLLTVSIFVFNQEKGGFYEKDLERVLAGEVIMPPPEDVISETDANSESISAENVEQQPSEEEAEAVRARELNDENFRTAVVSLKENEPMWGMQLEMCLNRKVTLELNFDSLRGDYQLVQPFIHQALTATLNTITQLAFDPAKTVPLPLMKKLVIHGVSEEEPCSACFLDESVDVFVPLVRGDAPPPMEHVMNAFRDMAGLAPLPLTSEAEVASEEMLFEKDAAEPAFDEDPYVAAAEFAAELRQVMEEEEIWPGEKPEGEIEVKGAFGCENMSFEQWLAWILIERVNTIVATRGSFPNGSNLAGYAIRALDGTNANRVISVLANFDKVVNDLAAKNSL